MVWTCCFESCATPSLFIAIGDMSGKGGPCIGGGGATVSCVNTYVKNLRISIFIVMSSCILLLYLSGATPQWFFLWLLMKVHNFLLTWPLSFTTWSWYIICISLTTFFLNLFLTIEILNQARASRTPGFSKLILCGSSVCVFVWRSLGIGTSRRH